MFLTPNLKGGKLVEIIRNETFAGVIRLSKVDHPKNSNQQSVFMVQGKVFYFFYITTSQEKAEIRFAHFIDMLEWMFEHRGYKRMQNFIFNYVYSYMGVYSGRRYRFDD